MRHLVTRLAKLEAKGGESHARPITAQDAAPYQGMSWRELDGLILAQLGDPGEIQPLSYPEVLQVIEILCRGPVKHLV